MNNGTNNNGEKKKKPCGPDASNNAQTNAAAIIDPPPNEVDAERCKLLHLINNMLGTRGEAKVQTFIQLHSDLPVRIQADCCIAGFHSAQGSRNKFQAD